MLIGFLAAFVVPGEQWCCGRVPDFGVEWEVPVLNLGRVAFCFSASLRYLLLSTKEYKWVPEITGAVACNEPASHPGGVLLLVETHLKIQLMTIKT
jgi:hypothetical protein